MEEKIQKYSSFVFLVIYLLIYLVGTSLAFGIPFSENLASGFIMIGLLLTFRLSVVSNKKRELIAVNKFDKIKIEITDLHKGFTLTELIDYKEGIDYRSKKDALLLKCNKKLLKYNLSKKMKYNTKKEFLVSKIDRIMNDDKDYIDCLNVGYKKIPKHFCYPKLNRAITLKFSTTYTTIIITSLLLAMVSNSLSVESVSFSFSNVLEIMLNIPIFFVQYTLALKDATLMADNDFTMLTENKNFLIDYKTTNKKEPV